MLRANLKIRSTDTPQNYLERNPEILTDPSVTDLFLVELGDYLLSNHGENKLWCPYFLGLNNPNIFLSVTKQNNHGGYLSYMFRSAFEKVAYQRLMLSSFNAIAKNATAEEIVEFFLKRNPSQVSFILEDYLYACAKNEKESNFLSFLTSNNELSPILYQYYGQSYLNVIETCKDDSIAVEKIVKTKKEITEESKKYLHNIFKTELIAQLSAPDINEDFLNDLATIHVFLTSKQLFVKALSQLNDDIEKAILEVNPKAILPWNPDLSLNEEREDNWIRYTTFARPDTHVKPHKQQGDKSKIHFFQNFFLKWAQSNGMKLEKITGMQSIEEFNKMLDEKTLFKDNFFTGLGHGAWTHIIQWYCISLAVRNNDITLHSKLADIYKMLASVNVSADISKRIWDITFDAIYGSNKTQLNQDKIFIGRDSDFRAVNGLMGTLISKHSETRSMHTTLSNMLLFAIVKRLDKTGRLSVVPPPTPGGHRLV